MPIRDSIIVKAVIIGKSRLKLGVEVPAGVTINREKLYKKYPWCPVRFLHAFHLLPKSCHSRILLAGIYDERAFRYPIKAFGYDKSRACKNLTGHH